MSHPIQNTDADVLGLDTGLEALQASPAFDGPVEPVPEHSSYDHLALLYETQAEQFATAIPYVTQGLERGERCLYIADENDVETILAALRDAGVDVDGALESGALTVHTAQESYLRNGAFDPDDMIAFLSDAIDEAATDYEGLRITGEMTWVFGDDPPLEKLIEYEAKLNRFLPDADGIALCQYNREQFSAEIVRDIIKTHPHLIADQTVCQNFYYTPPEEFFGPDQPEREIDRMMGTLLDRTEARAELQDHHRYLERQTEITANTDRSFEEKLQELFDLGCERFDLELGAMARVDTDDDWFEIEHVSDDHAHFEPGVELPLSETYCHAATDVETTRSVSDPRREGCDDLTVYEEFGLRAYLGTSLPVEGGNDRTFFFVSDERRDTDFTDGELTFHRLLGQWVKYQLEQEQRESNERTLYEIAADPDRSFDEKRQAMLELGCERFDLELGGMARIDPATDSFEVEAVSDDHDHLTPGTQVPLSETYCRLTVDGEQTASVTDPVDAGFGGTLAYEEFGVKTYLGTQIELENAPDRTLFFVGSDPQNRAFTDAERTFHHLLSQWMQYELERKQRERALEESNERLEQFAYAASHDLQEPLRMVTSYLQLLEGRYDDAFDADGREFLGFAVDGAERMRDMIDGLLAYSRVETRGDPFEPMELETVLEDVLDDLQLQIGERDAEVTAERLPRVDGDASQLRQVFQNLLSNAITYSGDEPPRVHVGAKRRGREWVISVRDEGIGIDPADHDRVFTVFDRLHSHEEYEGTGLGLALSQRIVERHDGDIWVDSKPGEGATFSFTLPACTDR
ncbi:MEDS domain-containing protein [Natrinema salaciae]|uniref:histidine kinase n=1 Tax=Natrinema salaciae TaxID=1186196 RepID=A0A1H8ZCJ1_9EURY|nr:MEDS domain-containing protein [Natrinema salaciae]SEP62094.1 His Kinase A (phospho-acceptor) domain-containing protein [Natrinema salaciae]